MSLAQTMAAGALMMLWLSMCSAKYSLASSSFPPSMPTYAAMTLPAVFANPPTMMHMISERVILSGKAGS